MGYDPTSGVLTSFTDPNGNAEQYSYDSKGCVSKVVEANGGGWTLTRSGSNDQSAPYTVTMTSGMGRMSAYSASEKLIWVIGGARGGDCNCSSGSSFSLSRPLR